MSIDLFIYNLVRTGDDAPTNNGATMSDVIAREDAPVLDIDPFSTESLSDPLRVDELVRETA